MSVKLSLGGVKKKKKVPEKKIPSLFDVEENDDTEKKDEGGPMDWRMQMQTYKRKRVDDQQLQKAKEEDPSFAEYDEVYDSMKSAQSSEVKKKDVSSKYMETMIVRTHSRKIEQDKITARVKRKEIAQEKDVYGETEEFITPTYKKRLEEMEEWTKQQEVIDKRDADTEYNAGSFLRKMLDDVTEGKSAAIQTSLKTSSSSSSSSSPSSSPSSSSSSSSEGPEVKLETSSSKPIDEAPKKKPALVAGLNSRKSKEEEEEEKQLEFLEKERERRQKKEQEKKEKREQEREAKRRKKYERRNTDASIAAAQKRYFERKGLPFIKSEVAVN